MGQKPQGVTELGTDMSINTLENHPSRIPVSADGRTITLGDNTAGHHNRVTSRALHFPMRSQHEVLETPQETQLSE